MIKTPEQIKENINYLMFAFITEIIDMETACEALERIYIKHKNNKDIKNLCEKATQEILFNV